ncbi:MAG: hypothetical protein ACQEP6_02875 [Patescibacteria group bacterium]
MDVDAKTGLVHEWTLICWSSAIDKDSGSLSLFNVIDKLTVNREHFEKHLDEQKEIEENEKKDFIVPAEFEIVTAWSKSTVEPLSLETKTELFDPYGKALFRFSYNISLKEGRNKRRNRSKIKGFKVTGEGVYSVNLSIRKDEGEEYRPVSKANIDVVLRTFGKKEDSQ